MGGLAVELVLTEAERAELSSLASRRNTAQALALRARIVLACADGAQNKDVAVRLALDPATVSKWRRRFAEHRLQGLRDDPRAGAPRMVDDERVEAVIARTLESLPMDGTHWSSRGMARASGLSVSTVQRIWRAFGLQPHRSETFKLSTDPDFVAKVRDVVGLYMAPPERALALCVDETEAAERAKPDPGARPHPAVAAHAPRPGRTPQPRLHAPRHHGTVCRPRHRHRPGDRQVLCPAPRGRVPPLPRQGGGQRARRPRRAPGDGQLRHAQGAGREGLAAQAAALARALWD